MESQTPRPSVHAVTEGRAQYIGADGTLYISRGHAIHSSKDQGASWSVECFIPVSSWKVALTRFQPSARLLRYYIGGFRILSDGTRIAIARDGIYRAERGNLEMDRVFPIFSGSRPLNLTVDREDHILFGEYGPNRRRREIYLHVSADRGRTFEVAYQFRAGEIRHVHNVLYDVFMDKYWVFVGDYAHEPGIGLLSKDLSRLEWFARASQRARIVAAIIERDCLIFGTDSELEQNYIVHMDKATRQLRELIPIEGTSLFASRFGNVRLISSCVEPSAVNRSTTATLYASCDGLRWHPVRSFQKDFLPFVPFQFGTLVLPYSDFGRSLGMFSGQAVRELDNRVCVVSFHGGSRKNPH